MAQTETTHRSSPRQRKRANYEAMTMAAVYLVHLRKTGDYMTVDEIYGEVVSRAKSYGTPVGPRCKIHVTANLKKEELRRNLTLNANKVRLKRSGQDRYIDAIQAVESGVLAKMSENDLFGLLVEFFMRPEKELHRGQPGTGTAALHAEDPNVSGTEIVADDTASVTDGDEQPLHTCDNPTGDIVDHKDPTMDLVSTSRLEARADAEDARNADLEEVTTRVATSAGTRDQRTLEPIEEFLAECILLSKRAHQPQADRKLMDTLLIKLDELIASLEAHVDAVGDDIELTVTTTAEADAMIGRALRVERHDADLPMQGLRRETAALQRIFEEVDTLVRYIRRHDQPRRGSSDARARS